MHFYAEDRSFIYEAMLGFTPVGRGSGESKKDALEKMAKEG